VTGAVDVEGRRKSAALPVGRIKSGAFGLSFEVGGMNRWWSLYCLVGAVLEATWPRLSRSNIPTEAICAAAFSRVSGGITNPEEFEREPKMSRSIGAVETEVTLEVPPKISLLVIGPEAETDVGLWMTESLSGVMLRPPPN